MGQHLTLTSPDGHSFGAYRADPTGSPKGAIVVIQEIFGVNSHIRAVTDRFAKEGYRVRVTADGDEALAMADEDAPDLVILDWMIEGTSGIEVLRRLRRGKGTEHVPIIMLTARGAEDDRIRGLDTGADDYIMKPFSPRELLARINAVLRRSNHGGGEELIEADGLVLDAAGHRVMVGDRTVQLGPTEYRLLSFFMTHAERVYSRAQLLDRVWGGNVYVEERTVDVHIRRLRKALEAFAYDRFIQTVRGSGYRFSTRAE